MHHLLLPLDYFSCIRMLFSASSIKLKLGSINGKKINAVMRFSNPITGYIIGFAPFLSRLEMFPQHYPPQNKDGETLRPCLRIYKFWIPYYPVK